MCNLSNKLLGISLLVVSSVSCKKDDVNVNRRICVECKISQNGQTIKSESFCGTEAEIAKFRSNFYFRYLYYSGEKDCIKR
jgi:hypothetical protein